MEPSVGCYAGSPPHAPAHPPTGAQGPAGAHGVPARGAPWVALYSLLVMETPDTDAPPSSDPSRTAPPSFWRALGTVLLGIVLGSVALVLFGAFVTWMIGVTARRFGLSELHMLVACSILAVLVTLVYVGTIVVAAIDRAGGSVADEVEETGDKLAEALEEIPIFIAPMPPGSSGARRGKRRGVHEA